MLDDLLFFLLLLHVKISILPSTRSRIRSPPTSVLPWYVQCSISLE